MALSAIRNFIGLSPPITPLFPACLQLHKDVALLILDKLTDGDLARMAQVSKKWKHFIQAVPVLNYRLTRNAYLCMARAIKFENEGHFNALCRKTKRQFRLAIVDPRHDLTDLKQEINKECISNIHSLVLQKIVQWEARNDLAAAITTALEHDDIPWLLLEVVKIKAPHDLITARSIVEIIEDQIQDPAAVARAHLIIAKASDRNFTPAKAAAERIENLVEKINVLLRIAKVDPQVDLSVVKALVPMISPYGQACNVKATILTRIIKLEAKLDLIEAKKTVETIHERFSQSPDDYEQSKALVEIVKVEAMKDPAAAKVTVKRIKNQYNRSRAVVAFVKVEALYDIEAAITTAIIMEDDGEAFVEIVKVQLQKNREGAIAIANMIKNPYYKTLAYLEIAKWDSKHDLTAVKAAAEKIVYDDFDTEDGTPCYMSDYDRALWKIVKVEVLYDLNGAKVTTSKIQDNDYRFKACLEIARVAQSRLPCAWQLPQGEKIR